MWIHDTPQSQHDAGTDQIGFAMLIPLDASWGFHATELSSISLKMFSNRPLVDGDQDMLISFSVAGEQFFSLNINMDNNDANQIYPQSGDDLAKGNVSALVNEDNGLKRYEKTSDSNFQDIDGTVGQNAWPMHFELLNDPLNDTLRVRITNPSITDDADVQSVTFSSSFATEQGMQIFFDGDDWDETPIAWTRFELEYFTSEPTVAPTS